MRRSSSSKIRAFPCFSRFGRARSAISISPQSPRRHSQSARSRPFALPSRRREEADDAWRIERAGLLALHYNLSAERWTRSHPRVFCHFDDLLRDWRKPMRRSAPRLASPGLTGPKRPKWRLMRFYGRRTVIIERRSPWRTMAKSGRGDRPGLFGASGSLRRPADRSVPVDRSALRIAALTTCFPDVSTTDCRRS